MSLDALLDGMDAWSKAQVLPSKKPVAPMKKVAEEKPQDPPKKKVLKKRKIDQFFNKVEPDPSKKKTKAQEIIQILVDKEEILASPLGQEPLIATPEQCALAIKEIMSGGHKLVALDCEGVNLGRNGRLCLVQIATPTKSYLFDLIPHGPAIFDSGLRKLLEDVNITKIVHDCRLDSDALFHEHKVDLANIFDTQVAYAIVTRGKGYSTPLPVSLNTLLRHYAHGASNEVKDLMKKAMQEDPEYWLKRPMEENALKYARQDVTHLCTVQRQIDALLTVASRKTVVHYSNHYLDQCRKLEAATVRESVDPNSKERYIPKYGITEWDLDTAQNLERNAGRPRKSR